MLHTCAAERREDRGVVARAGADVEDALVALELEQLAHPRDDERLRDRLAGSRSAAARSPRLRRPASGGTNSSRGTARIAASTRWSDRCGRKGDQPVPAGPAFHAITPPAARTSASARSESPVDLDAAHGGGVDRHLEARAQGVESGVPDAVVGREPDDGDLGDAALAQSLLQPCALEAAVAVGAGLALVDDHVDPRAVERGMQFRALRAGHAVHRPRRAEGAVVGRVPVTRGDDEVVVAGCGERVDPLRDLIAVAGPPAPRRA